MKALKSVKAWSDQIMAEGLLNGSREAYLAFHERFADIIYMQCLDFCGDEDEAPDLLNEILLKAVMTIGMYDNGKACLATWVNRLAMNYLRDYYRKKTEETELIQCEEEFFDLQPGRFSAEEYCGDDDLDEVSAEEKAAGDPDIVRLNSALQSISPRDRSILRYRADGFSYESISGFLGVNLSAAMTACHRALKKVRAEFYREAVGGG